MFEKINNNIMEILGINTLPKEEQIDAMEDLGALVYQETITVALELLDEEGLKGFQDLLEMNPEPEKLFTYLSTKVPTLETIATEEATKVKDARERGEIGL